jgi:hypothetical protein
VQLSGGISEFGTFRSAVEVEIHLSCHLHWLRSLWHRHGHPSSLCLCKAYVSVCIYKDLYPGKEMLTCHLDCANDRRGHGLVGRSRGRDHGGLGRPYEGSSRHGHVLEMLNGGEASDGWLCHGLYHYHDRVPDQNRSAKKQKEEYEPTNF